MGSKKILVLDAYRPPALTVMRSLFRAGYTVHAAAPWDTRNYNLFSRYLNKRIVYTSQQEDPSAFQDFVLRMSDLYDVILPIAEDSELILSRIRYLLNPRCLVPIPDSHSLEIAMDKGLTMSFAESCGIPIPKTVIPEDVSKIEGLGINFPAIVKLASETNVPVFPRYEIVNDYEALSKAYNFFAKFGTPLIQEYVEGNGVGAFYLFNSHSEAVGAITHRRIVQYPIQGGFSAIAQSTLDREALEYSMKILRALDWKGVAMVEFRRTGDGSLKLMEINPRFWGSISLAVFSGINFPRLLIEMYDSQVLEENWKFPSYTKRNMVRASVLAKAIKQSLAEGRTDVVRTAVKTILQESSITDFEDIGKDMGPLFAQVYIAAKDNLETRLAKVRKKFYLTIHQPNFSLITNQLAVGGLNSVSTISKSGFGFIVDLREANTGAEEGAAKRTSIDYLNVPTSDNHTPSQKDLELISARIDLEIASGKKVIIHCEEGRGRAPSVACAYLMSKGLSFWKASDLIKSKRALVNFSTDQLSSLEEFSRKAREKRG